MHRVEMGTLLILSAAVDSCAYIDRNYENIVWGPASSTVHVASDGGNVRSLLSEAEIRDAEWARLSMPWGNQADYQRFVADYMPLRHSLIDAMDRATGFGVAGGSYCRILERSHAQCESAAAFYSTTYVKIRVTTGASKGKEGWVCQGKVPVAADGS
jgi:hypothetical protein